MPMLTATTIDRLSPFADTQASDYISSKSESLIILCE